jgi:hypothetical protein
MAHLNAPHCVQFESPPSQAHSPTCARPRWTPGLRARAGAHEGGAPAVAVRQAPAAARAADAALREDLAASQRQTESAVNQLRDAQMRCDRAQVAITLGRFAGSCTPGRHGPSVHARLARTLARKCTGCMRPARDGSWWRAESIRGGLCMRGKARAATLRRTAASAPRRWPRSWRTSWRPRATRRSAWMLTGGRAPRHPLARHSPA